MIKMAKVELRSGQAGAVRRLLGAWTQPKRKL